MLTPWFSSINTWNGTSIDSTDCIYILIVLYLYIQHDGYICPSIGINKFKRWKRQWKASPVFFLRFHPLSPYSSMFQLQGETGETYESKVHVILMRISNWKQILIHFRAEWNHFYCSYPDIPLSASFSSIICLYLQC